MLSKKEFDVVLALHAGSVSSQRSLANETGLSLGSVNATLKKLASKGLVQGYELTSEGRDVLASHKVDNAVILAAGLSSRFAPISYEKPKGILQVRDEVLIERQIRQLKEAGIDDITVVVGYKKEYFFYLEDALGVSIVVNEEYASRNNHSSLMVVRDRLKNTYICSSDDYFVENPFEPYVWKAYYAAQYVEGPTREWCIGVGSGDRITSVEIGGSDAWVMIGHVYFDQRFSEGFSRILVDEYDRPDTVGKLWEDLYADHLSEFDMLIRRYDPPIAYEFDTLDEVREFDPHFISNVDSAAFDNIVKVVGCAKEEIRDIYPLKQGLTNLSCHVSAGTGEYVYRHPGVGTEQIIDRNAELAALTVAKELGLDGTFLFEDPAQGWKVSRFIPGCRELDPRDKEQVKLAMRMARRLHDSGASVTRTFDFYDEGKRYEALMQAKAPVDVPGYAEMSEKAERLHSCAARDGVAPCLTHNDFFHLNFLIDAADRMHLIDWEYAGMSDYASDFGTFTVCSQLSEEEADWALACYFDREPTFEERRHNYAFVALAGWCWYVWSLYKESEGECVGAWLYVYYDYARRYLDKVLGWYERGSTEEVA